MRNFSVFKSFPTAILAVSLLLGISSCGLTGGKSDAVVVFDSLKVDTIVPFLENSDKPALTINVNFDYPVSGSEDLVTATGLMINNLVEGGIYTAEAGSDVNLMVQKFIESHAQAYHDERNDELFDGQNDIKDVPWLNYEAQLQGSVLWQKHNLISYQVMQYAYNGGAHGQTLLNYGVLDALSGEQIHLSNIVDEVTHSAILDLYRKHMAEFFECADYETLLKSDLLFPDVEIDLNENFFFDDKGIIWVTNTYEIAPYSTGTISVLVPWDELQDLLPAESIALRVYEN